MKAHFGHLLFFLIPISLVFSCKPKNQNYELVLEKSYGIPIDSSVLKSFSGDDLYQITEFDGKEVYICYRSGFNVLWFYSIEDGALINKFPLDSKTLSGFYCYNKDSIFLLYANQYQDGLFDSTIFQLADHNGVIKKYYKLDHPLMSSIYNESFDKKTAIYPDLLSGNLNVNGNNIIIHFRKYEMKNIGTPEFMQERSPVIGVYNYVSEELKLCENYWFPNADTGVYYPSDSYLFSSCFNSKGNPVIRYVYSSTLTEWDLSSDKLIQHYLKSGLIDTIKPTCRPKRNSGNEIEARYYRLTYDPYREMYYSLLLFNTNVFGSFGYSYTIADDNLNYQTEIFMPELRTFQPMFTKDYIIGFGWKQPDTLVLNYFKIERSGNNQNAYISSIRDSLQQKKDMVRANVKNLQVNCETSDGENCVIYAINTMNIEDDNFTLISMFLDGGCLGCRDFVLQLLSDNEETLSDGPLYLILSASNEDNYNNALKNYDLSQYTRISADKGGLLKTILNESSVNPRLTIVKDNKIELDTIYLPDQLETDFPEKLVESLNLSLQVNGY